VQIEATRGREIVALDVQPGPARLETECGGQSQDALALLGVDIPVRPGDLDQRQGLERGRSTRGHTQVEQGVVLDLEIGSEFPPLLVPAALHANPRELLFLRLAEETCSST
jgi:hypothetical protein